ncbi:unnamed protein product [Ectocarpus sp. 6 AP-2014]
MNAKVGPETILSKEEEDSLEDILLFAARNFLAVDRIHLRDRCGATTLQRRSADPLGSREGSGEKLACGLPS